MRRISSIFVAIVIAVAGFLVYRHIVYYVGNGSLFSAKIASIAVAKGNPKICDKIKGAYINLGSPTEEETRHECYYHFMTTNKNEELCSLIENNGNYTSNYLCTKWAILNNGRQYVTTNHIDVISSSHGTQKIYFKDYGTFISLPSEINGVNVEIREIQTPVSTDVEFVYEGNIIRLEGETDTQKTANYRCWDKNNDNNQLPKIGDPFVINPSHRNKLINWGYSKNDGKSFFSFTTDKIYCQLYDGGPLKLEMFRIDIQ